MNVWLFAENQLNREIDEKNQFRFFVIDKRKLKKRNFLNDDYLITYVTKIMKITDVRQIVSNIPKVLPPNIKYDRNFDYYLETKLVKNLENSEWINRSSIFPKLEIFQNKITNLVLLGAPIKLPESDAKELLSLFNI